MPTGPRLVEALVNDIVDRQQLAIDNRTNPIDKCQDVLDAAGRPRLNIGSGTGQTFDVARRLRNALVHYTPEWEHDFINGALYRDLTNRHRPSVDPIHAMPPEPLRTHQGRFTCLVAVKNDTSLRQTLDDMA